MQSIGDFQLMRRIVQSLASDPLVPKDCICVEVHAGCIFLSGAVPRRLQSWTAEADARRAAPFAAIENRITFSV